MHRRVRLPLLVPLLLAGCGTLRPPQDPSPPREVETTTQDPATPTIGQILVSTEDIYDLEENPGFFYEAVNFLNVVVQEDVVRREVDLVIDPGEPFDPELLEEIERNLRRLSFVATATATPVPQDDGTVDVHVKTRDRFTLNLGVGFGFFGGDSKARVSLAESDFFGTGKRVQTTYKTDPDRDTLEFKFTDPQLFGSEYVLDLKLADLSDGHAHFIEVVKPFKTLDTDWAYGANASSTKRDIRFFESGDEVAAVPLDSTETSVFFRRSFGPREQLTRVGMRASFRDDQYRPATGQQAALIRVPDDQRTTTVGPTLSLDWIPRYEKRTQIDAIDFVEDIPIGVRLDSFVGAQFRDPRDGSGNWAFAAEAGARGAVFLGDDHLLSARAATRFREDSEPLGWSADAFGHYYFLGFPAQTVLVSLAANGGWENEDLNIQTTLGEDNGLRGYPSREFSGHKRVRLNVEDRIFTDIEVLSVHLGAVVFFDAGMVWDRGESMRVSDLARSVGIGLRLGSAELFGDNVIRLDVGFPLDDVDGEDYDVSFVATVGQAVSLFGNAEAFANSLPFGL